MTAKENFTQKAVRSIEKHHPAGFCLFKILQKTDAVPVSGDSSFCVHTYRYRLSDGERKKRYS